MSKNTDSKYLSTVLRLLACGLLACLVLAGMPALRCLHASDTVAVGTMADEPTPQRDRLHGAEISESGHRESVLPDVHSIYRICSSRPERIVPTGGGHSGPSCLRVTSPAGTMMQSVIFAVTLSRLSAVPVRHASPCRYYVFELGRMLC